MYKRRDCQYHYRQHENYNHLSDYTTNGTTCADRLRWVLFKKIQNQGTKWAWPRSRDLLSILGSLQYFLNGESYKFPKVVSGDDGNLRAEPSSWSRGRAASGRGRGFGRVCPPLPLKLNICIPVSQFCLQFCSKRSEDAKNQSACYISPSSIPLSTSLRPVAEIWYWVGCNSVTCFNHDRGNWRNSAQ